MVIFYQLKVLATSLIARCCINVTLRQWWTLAYCLSLRNSCVSLSSYCRRWHFCNRSWLIQWWYRRLTCQRSISAYLFVMTWSWFIATMCGRSTFSIFKEFTQFLKVIFLLLGRLLLLQIYCVLHQAKVLWFTMSNSIFLRYGSKAFGLAFTNILLHLDIYEQIVHIFIMLWARFLRYWFSHVTFHEEVLVELCIWWLVFLSRRRKRQNVGRLRR